MPAKKRPSLADVEDLKKSAGSRRVSLVPEVTGQDNKPEDAAPPDRKTQPGRVGTKPITGHFPPDVRKQLKEIALERDDTVQNLLAEALNDLFVKYSRPEIAPRTTRE